MMEILNIKQKDFESFVEKGNVLVDFYAEWCGPCKMIHGELEKIKDKVEIIKVNVDENRELSKKYGVMSIPTLIYFKKDGSYISTIGFMRSEDILNFIKG